MESTNSDFIVHPTEEFDNRQVHEPILATAIHRSRAHLRAGRPLKEFHDEDSGLTD